MINKRLPVAIITILVILTLVVLAVAGCSKPAATTAPTAAPTTTAAAKVIEIKMPTGNTFWQGEGGTTAGTWMKEVEAATNGRVKFNVLLGAAPEPTLYDVIADGSFDVAMNPVMFNTGRFLTMEAGTFPDVGQMCAHPSKAVYDVWQQSDAFKKEFADTHLISVWAATPSPPGICLGMTDQPINKLEDLKGKKIGTYGEWGQKRLEALGAAVVTIPPPTIYEDVQKKIADGTLMDAEMLFSSKLQELIKYIHMINFQFVPFWLVMNNDTWNSLPADIQQIMMEKGKDIPDIADKYHGDSNTKGVEEAKANYGLTVITYSEEELARWNAATLPVTQQYIEMLNKKGLDGEATLAMWRAAYTKYK